MKSLLNKSLFIGLEEVVHLAAGGESPMLKSHRDMLEKFALDKATGETARDLEAEMTEKVRSQCAELLSAKSEDITFLSSASDGINNVTYGLDWQEGDNVVIVDVEFPSGILPWTRLAEQGVEIRIVRHKDWYIDIADIEAQMDDRTRVVEISHVSMFTGQRIDVAKVSDLVRASNAILLLDVTHSAGVVPVEAQLADVAVSSCYKWLLGTHGTGIFYVNRERMPDFEPPFLGWNSPSQHGGWKAPTEFSLQPTAHRFQPGNANFLGIYILNNALNHLLDIGIKNIESHVLKLSGKIHSAVSSLDVDMMTPGLDNERAGNVCFIAHNQDKLIRELEKRKVLIWGAYAGFGRLRVSTHAYNDENDVEQFIEVLKDCLN